MTSEPSTGPPANVADLGEHRLAADLARVRRKAANLSALAEALADASADDTASALHDLARNLREAAGALPQDDQ